MPKISALPAGTTPTGTELVPAVQAGATVRLTAAQVAGAATTLNLVSPAAATVPFSIKGTAGQTGDLLQLKDSANVLKLQATKDGNLRWPTTETTTLTPYVAGRFEQPWTNGPVGETNYTDHVFVAGYNVNPATGVAIDTAKSSVWVQWEHRFYQTFPSGASSFGPEWHVNMRRLNGTGGNIRPLGFSMSETTGEVSGALRGSWAFERSDGSNLLMQLHEANKLLNLNDNVSLAIVPPDTANATIDIGGRAGTYPSITATAGATQTQRLLDLRRSNNQSALRVESNAEVFVGTPTSPSGLIVNFVQNDGAALTLSPAAIAQGAIAIRRLSGQTGHILTVYTHDQSALLFALDKDGKLLMPSPNGSLWRCAPTDGGAWSVTAA